MVRRLASDIPALWRAPTTTARDRQAIARLMLERVVILVHGERAREPDVPLGRGRRDPAHADPPGSALRAAGAF